MRLARTSVSDRFPSAMPLVTVRASSWTKNGTPPDSLATRRASSEFRAARSRAVLPRSYRAAGSRARPSIDRAAAADRGDHLGGGVLAAIAEHEQHRAVDRAARRARGTARRCRHRPTADRRSTGRAGGASRADRASRAARSRRGGGSRCGSVTRSVTRASANDSRRVSTGNTRASAAACCGTSASTSACGRPRRYWVSASTRLSSALYGTDSRSKQRPASTSAVRSTSSTNRRTSALLPTPDGPWT